IVWWKPRLLMTGATTVSLASAPRSCSASAQTARIASPSTSSPSAVTARQRSASPSCARPRSAPVSRTAAISGSRCVDPMPSLMFQPSGRSPIACTVAPAWRYTSGAMVAAAPWAPSTTSVRPDSGRSTVPSRWATYSAAASDRSRTRPTSAPVGRWSSVAPEVTVRSIAASSASGSLCPPRLKSLMPLSGIGLWLAEIMTPRSASWAAVRNASARVGTTPARSTSAPALVRPATTAASSISPLARGSRPTTATGRDVPSRSASTTAAARATERASSGGRSAVGRPRTPSVPKRRPTKRSALRVLRRLAGLLQAVLLALRRAGVAGQEAGLLEGRTVLGLDLDQRAGDGQAQRACLAGHAAALEEADDVVLLGLLQDHERLADELLVHLVREVLLEGAAVQLELPGTREQSHADDGLLAPAHGLDGTPLGVGHGQGAGHLLSSLALVGVVTDGAVLIGSLASSLTEPPA